MPTDYWIDCYRLSIDFLSVFFGLRSMPHDRSWTISNQNIDDISYRIEEKDLLSNMEGKYIKVSLSRQFLSVYNDNQLIYEYKGDSKGIPHRGIYKILIEPEYIGKSFKMVMSSPYAYENNLMWYTVSSEQIYYPHGGNLEYVIGIFCLVLGLTAGVVAIMWTFSNIKSIELYFLSFLAIIYGFFILSNTVIGFQALGSFWLYIIYWGSFWLYPIFFALFLYYPLYEEKKKWPSIFVLMPIVYVLVCMVLEVSNIAPVALTEFWYTGIASIAIISLFILNIFSKNSYNKFMKYAIILILIWSGSYFMRSKLGYTPDFSVEIKFLTNFFIAGLIVYFLRVCIVRQLAIQRNEIVIKLKNESLLNNYHNIEKKIEETAELRHEMRHHFSTLNMLYKDNMHKALGKYLNQINHYYVNVNPMIYSKNYLLQSIASTIQYEAKNLGFSIDFLIDTPENIPIDEMDFSSILFNILENGLESCSEVSSYEKRWMKIRILYDKKLLFIKVENAHSGRLEKENNVYLTTKAQKSIHGNGLKIVRKIVKKYDGILEISDDICLFSVKIILNT